MLSLATLLLAATAVVRVTGPFLALFAGALALQFEWGAATIRPALFAALALLAIWGEAALVRRGQAWTLDGPPPPECYMGAGAGLGLALVATLAGVPGGAIGLPVLTAALSAAAVRRRRRNWRLAWIAAFSLMTDPADGKYLRRLLLVASACLLLRDLRV